MGASIRTRRQGLGITQEELAWRASLHRTYIADVERGVRNVTLRTVGQLAHALKASVADLLTEARPVQATGATVKLGEILVVEDSPTDAEMTMRAFRQSKLCNPIRVVTDGAAALEFLFGPKEKRSASAPPLPQLILLDLHLPKVPGLEVLRRIRADEHARAIPVTVLTVSRRDRDIHECRSLGVEHYIMKPVTPESFGRIAVSLSLDWALMPSTSSSPVVSR